MQDIYTRHADIINTYYRDNAKKLHNVIDQILYKLGFGVDNEDFYSLGNEIFIDVLSRYDESKAFDGFLYSCLMNKFKTEMTRRNRKKRQADREAISLNTPIGGDLENSVLEDVISSNHTVESMFFGEDEDTYSESMQLYLSRLSPLQQKVLRLISIGYSKCDIIKKLRMNVNEYEDCYNAIHSYRNISILF